MLVYQIAYQVHAQSIPDYVTPEMIVESLPDVESVIDADMVYPIFIIGNLAYTAEQFIADVERLVELRDEVEDDTATA